MHPCAAPPLPFRVATSPAAATRRLAPLRAPFRARRTFVRASKEEMFSSSGSDTQQAHDAAKKAAAEAEKAAAKIREAAVPVRLLRSGAPAPPFPAKGFLATSAAG